LLGLRATARQQEARNWGALSKPKQIVDDLASNFPQKFEPEFEVNAKASEKQIRGRLKARGKIEHYGDAPLTLFFSFLCGFFFFFSAFLLLRFFFSSSCQRSR
jgi:hypothetical protein